MDYLYTSFHQANLDGTPVLNPLWYKYPQDTNTFPIDLQFLYGPSILVSPVTEENVTSVTAYFPKDIFYDFLTLQPFQGQGANVTLDNVNFTSVPVHIRGGAILPLRATSAMTTAELRKRDFELVVAPDASGAASGALYVDDGVSIDQPRTTNVDFGFGSGKLVVAGTFGFDVGVNVARVRFLGVGEAPKGVLVNGHKVPAFAYDRGSQVLDVTIDMRFNKGFTVQYA